MALIKARATATLPRDDGPPLNRGDIVEVDNSDPDIQRLIDGAYLVEVQDYDLGEHVDPAERAQRRRKNYDA
jgi:hypothetical protein